ncbi:hypothetical protein CYK89_01385 [Clostridium perfringens]|uniref:type 2 lanthipeptide synthetase LanM family protein n=1 Tax=Clostridium perfringens TaxID=1502 RepID=UPI000D718E9A|nr:type 2 lanthipeptide synthetase LanM family protein [Clostridium perfringens]PWX39054.1 hypothetical protein CYK90_11860 [Clostridium perfringens]PWX56931.1 hypothetical protein CYK89_01385 [Clostridium perfringens]
MDKREYYEFWGNFFPDIKDFNIIEKIYKEIFETSLSEDTLDMISKFKSNELVSEKDEELLFYLRNKRNFYYKETYDYFKKNAMYYNFYKPYINYLIKKIYSVSELFPNIKVQILFESLEIGLLNILAPISARVLIRETEIKRLKNELIGSNKKERFLYYNNKLLKDDNYILDLYKKYPVLFNILMKKTKSYISFITEVLKNIEKDNDDIRAKFNIDMLKDNLIAMDVGVGDEHNSGKSVIILIFENNKKIVYKPRSLKLDYNFNELLNWLNNHELKLKLKDIKILDKNNYGYVEFINNDSCQSEELIKDYYIRSGYLLALIYSLNGSDLHYENIIANGEYPIIVDLETLFNPKIRLNNIDDIGEKFAIEKIYESVLTIGMLPCIFKNNDLIADYSGLGFAKDQMSPFKSFNINNKNCDDISINLINNIIKTQKNNPVLNNKIVDSNNYIKEILYGFREMYELLLNNKENYKIFVKKVFNNMNIRVLMKSTIEYSSLLETSYHPDMFMDELTRKILLCRIYLSEEKNTYIKEAEYKSLLNGDIPYFSMKINMCDVYSNNKVFLNQTLLTPMEYFLEKVDNMCEKDMHLQEKFICKSYLNLRQKYDLDKTKFDFNKIKFSNSNKSNYRDLLDSIAQYIIDESIVFNTKLKKYRIWIGSTFNEDDKGYTDINYIGQDLYNGQAGISLFLMYYGKATKNSKYYSYAKEALIPCINFIENFNKKIPYTVGAFSGSGGKFFALYNLYNITKDGSLKKYIFKYLDFFEHMIEKDKLYDVVSGSAGLVHILLFVFENCKENDILNKVNICIMKATDHLINSVQVVDDNSMTWKMNIENEEKAYSGFGHGNSGIISALARYCKTFSKDKSELIEKVLNYENSLFNNKERNWYRDSDKDMISLGWCHGVSGILLSKLLLIKNGFNHLVDKEKLNIAIDTTISKSFGNNPCLCHGDLGNLEIIYFLSRIFNDKSLEKKCETGFSWIVENIIKNRWKGTSYRGVETFGLMIGLTGFGYALLKFCNFDDIPSVLYFG